MTQAAPRKSPPKKSGGGSFWIFLLLILGGLATSEFAGPTQGWMGIAAKPAPVIAAVPAPLMAPPEKPAEKPADIKPDVAPATPAPEPPKEVKSQAELLFDRYLVEEVAKLPKAALGKPMMIYFKTGEPQEMIPTEILTEKERVRLEYVGIKGRSEPHYSVLRRDSMELFFPEKKAARLALKRVSDELSARIVPPPAPVSVAVAQASTASSSKSAGNWLPKFDAFVAIPSDSPEHLKYPQMELQNWLNVQARRSHVALVDSLYAKQQGAAAVLYLGVSGSFVGKSMEERMQLAEAFRQFWSLRCMSNGVAADDKAFICLVSQGKIVGGSQLKDADDVWVKK